MNSRPNCQGLNSSCSMRRYSPLCAAQMLFCSFPCAFHCISAEFLCSECGHGSCNPSKMDWGAQAQTYRRQGVHNTLLWGLQCKSNLPPYWSPIHGPLHQTHQDHSGQYRTSKFPLYACSITPFLVLRARVGNREHMSGMVCYFYLTKSIFPLYSSCVPS